MKLPLACIRCGNQPGSTELPEGSEGVNQPYKATAFMTHGHYGSTAFDPMDGTILEINVCDECLHEAALLQRVALGRTHEPVLNKQGSIVRMRALGHLEQPPLKRWLPNKPRREESP